MTITGRVQAPHFSRGENQMKCEATPCALDCGNFQYCGPF